MPSKYLLLIAGPTAVGKTSLAIQLALYFKTEVLSADSRQFYKEMTVGTATPTLVERATVKHHFIDNLSIQDEYSAGMYEEDALALLEVLFKKYDTIVLTGGSGLFIKALCEGMDAIPQVDPQLRTLLNKEFETYGLAPLLEELKEKDPNYYEQVDKANPIRVIRALELCRGTGMPFSSFRTALKKERPFEIIKIGLNRDRSELYARIEQRMDAMLDEGLVEEVRALLPFRNLNALQTVGYSEVFGYLNGKYDYEEMVRLLKQNSRRYAKRQLTWFLKDKEMQWFEPNQEIEILDCVKKSQGL